MEEALLKMGILDALVIDEQYKEQVLKTEQGCEDHYLFICKNSQKNLQPDRSLLDVLELNEEVNDIFPISVSPESWEALHMIVRACLRLQKMELTEWECLPEL